MTDFKENIADIIDAWGSYPLKNPCSEDPAFNAGHVQLKCYINNVCPFYKTPYKEDSLIFNRSTFSELQQILPDNISGVLATTGKLDGLHFKYRKTFRHNYMYQFYEDVDNVNYQEKSDANYKYEYFEAYHQEISQTGTAGTTDIKGVDKTRYKREYSWITSRSVYDDLACENSAVEECSNQTSWAYEGQSISDNMMTDADIEYDYQYDYWLDYIESLETTSGKTKPKSGETRRIDNSNVLMPVQNRTHNKDGSGVHWKVVKRTPIFRGADFFIRFYRKATEAIRYPDSSGQVPFNSKVYAELDITNNDVVLVDPVQNFKAYVNSAVRAPSKKDDTDEEAIDPNIYNFYDQPYYIIEINREYFIIIPSRGFPTFVHSFNGENSEGAVSRRLGSPFEGISGKQLIEADYFDIVIRNHLGRLAIQFEGKGFENIPPWIIQRTDLVPEKVGNGEASYIAEKIRDLIIPKGPIGIWGGNIKCGFLFGYLQYIATAVSFVYPPRDDTGIGVVSQPYYKAFDNLEAEEATFSPDYFQSMPLWLPLNGEGDGTNTSHKLLFQAYDGFKLETGSIGDQATQYNDVPLFTQDCQYYINYAEGEVELYNLGYFYYNDPIREFSPQFAIADDADNTDAKNTAHVKTSNITVQKYRYMNDLQRRHQGFDVYIGMMNGDHLFTESFSLDFWNKTDGWKNTVQYLHPIQTIEDNPYKFSGDLIGDDEWLLPNCKTPIMTNIRLVAEPGPEPRWKDGTSISHGVRKHPENGHSPYFIDATDHVMSFSHSWSASSMTSMEHSGTIQFYLNHEMDVDNNVTSDLIALQDRTFYIEVWAGYRDLPGCTNSNYTKIPGFYKMFTGVCQGGKLSYEYGKNVMTCKLEDYGIVLKGMRFFNSPWFDAMKDTIAVKEIVRMAGFRDQGVYDPARLISELAASADSLSSQTFFNHFDGRTFKHEPFGLPSGYNRLEQPALKFNDGDPLIDAISKIAAMSAKLFYFDEFGIAHYEDYQDWVEQDFQGTLSLRPLYFFTKNPEVRRGQLVFNKIERSFDVSSVANHLKILSNTPDWHLLILDHFKWDSIENPETTGFLGFQRTAFQAESMFGSKEAVISAMNKYSVIFKPKIKVSFETYGLPLRATDIVSLEEEVVRVTKVNHAFDASKNQWWMQVECERFQPIDAGDIIPLPAPVEDE